MDRSPGAAQGGEATTSRPTWRAVCGITARSPNGCQWLFVACGLWHSAVVGGGTSRRGALSSARQRRARRTGITALSLLVLTATAAVVLARVYRLGVAATVVALLGGIPSLYLAWAAYPDDRAEAGTGLEKLEPAQWLMSLQLLRAQWAQEAGAWRLNDPFLPVGSVAADPPLADDWMSVIALAAGGGLARATS